MFTMFTLSALILCDPVWLQILKLTLDLTDIYVNNLLQSTN